MPNRKYRNYTDSDVIEAVKKSKSIAGVLKLLNLKTAGGNYANIQRVIQNLKCDCSHFTGQAWNKNQRIKNWSKYTRGTQLKPHLIKERGYNCEGCNLEKWMGKPIPLEVEHVDGDRTNNDKKNLKLLCPNCHALTPTWRRRKSSLSHV